MIKIPDALLADDIHGYTTAGQAAKNAFHMQGRKFLRELAQQLGLAKDQYSIRSNKGGMAVSGEVTLHADSVYVQLHESVVGSAGVRMLYRTCKGQQDYAGGPNNYASLKAMQSADVQEEVIARLQQMAAPLPA